ncbi:MAG: hypothetical protein GX301_01535 [Gracilibacteraceae bacterium]|nr:hypothetical protein [Gracilibacteraceae bacterium]
MVNEILDAFKDGKQDNAVFWIKAKGRMILIQYFALRDTKGKYIGGHGEDTGRTWGRFSCLQ